MFIRNNKKFFGIIISISCLLCLHASALTVINNPKMTNYEDEIFVPDNADIIPFEVKEIGQAKKIGTLSNVLISQGSDRDDYWPAITKDESGNIAITWTHSVSILDCNPGFAYSIDNGNTFTVQEIVMDGVQKYCDVALMRGSQYEQLTGVYDGLWLSCNDELNEAANGVLIDDVTKDPEEWTAWATSPQTLPGVKYCEIEDDSYYIMPYFDSTGPVEFRIDSSYCPDEWMLFWHSADLTGYVYNYDNEDEGYLDIAPASNPDLAPIHDSDPEWTEDDFFYTVAQHENDETGRSDIAFKRDIPIIEADIEYVEEQFYLVSGETFDAADPEVTASGDSVVVVYMINYGSGWDIECSYSIDRGQTWDTSIVANTGVDEKYPEIYQAGSNVYCVYIKQGNLYLIKSNDNGMSWGEPEQINNEDGTVLEEECSADIHQAGIVWTDNRNGDKDIYFVSGESAPLIAVNKITGGFGVSVEIVNVGTADASNVQWSISLDGGLILVGKSAEGTISNLGAGANTIVKIPFVLGFGGVTITATADGSSKTASGTVILFFVTGL